MGNMPDGAPLKLETTTKITHVSMPGMSPDQAAKINEMLAKRPPTVTHMTVTKIAVQDLPSGTFSIPAGYTERQLSSAGGAPPAAPASKVPE
jgi:hypothetical protein